MPIEEFKFPDVGEGVTEGELVNWLVEPGDTVTEDQPVAEVETDKALVEVPSPHDGTVKDLRADEGEIIPVGEVIITFEVADEAGADEGTDATERPESDEEVEAAGAETEAAEPEDEVGESEAEAAEPEAEAAGLETDGTTDPSAEAPTPEGRVFAPPSARRLARELGVDIAAVNGTGPSGRVSEADIRQYVESDEGTKNGGGSTEGPTSVSFGDRKQAVTKRSDDGTAAESTADVEPSAAEPSASEPSAAEPATIASASEPATAEPSVESADRDRTLAVPATRKVAREEGVDIDEVPTDETRDGEAFVTAEQVREFAARRGKVEAAGTAEAAEAADVTEAAESAAGAQAAHVGADVAGVSAPEGGEETVPYRGVRRTIGQQMERSKFTAPHVSHHDTAEVSALVRARSNLEAEADAQGVNLTYMPFVMKAVVAGLEQHPYLNSELREEDEEIVLKKEYNIGIAVATDAGLMVPVVKNVDEKGLLELAAEVDDLASRARERTIKSEEMQGGTFTITNFGAIGGEYATPIINYPETAILGLGAIEERPVVRDGEVVAAPTLPLSMSIDHRVVDGAEAAEFANTVMRYLEEPTLLLLE